MSKVVIVDGKILETPAEDEAMLNSKCDDVVGEVWIGILQGLIEVSLACNLSPKELARKTIEGGREDTIRSIRGCEGLLKEKLSDEVRIFLTEYRFVLCREFEKREPQ